MSNRQLVLLGLSVFAAAMVVPTLGRDPDPARTGVTTGPATRASNRGDFEPPPPGPMPPPERHRGWERLTPERIAELMAFAEKHLPEEYEQIKALQAENPRQAERLLRRLWWLYQQVQGFPPEIRGAAVARHRLRLAIYETQRKFHQTKDPTAKTELTDKLRSLLGEQFEQDQIIKEYQVKRLAQQLAELKAQIEQRRKDREKIVSDLLESLLRPPPRPPESGAKGRRQ